MVSLQGTGLTTSEIRVFQSATEGEIAQAQSLIARGKEGATRGDFRLSRIVNVIKTLSQDQVRQAISEAKARGLDVSQVEVERKGFGFEITGITESVEAQAEAEAQASLTPTGAILLKPSERELAEGITERGIPVSIPETGETFFPRTTDFFLGGDVPSPVSTIEAVEKPEGFFERQRQDIEFERGRLDETPTQAFFTESKASLIGTAEFGVDLFKTIITPLALPKKVIESDFFDTIFTPFAIPEKTLEVVQLVGGGGVGAEFGEQLKDRPTGALGFVATEALTFFAIAKTPKLITKIVDFSRTAGLKELQAMDIIAPEFFAGQTFPKIKKGQTAGELLGEFRPILPGERLPAGFTAAPRTFAKETEILRGTSELPGLFQAPLISPRFLRVGGEAEIKLFSLNVFETFRPTVARVTPLKFELLPGIKPGQQQIVSTAFAKEFFETAPKGRAFIPFIKREKEAIIPFGTELIQTQKKFFFKFEGRRIPILEFDVKPGVGVRGKIPRGKPLKLVTTKDIGSIVSRGRLKLKSVFTPLDLSSVAKQFSRSGLKPLKPSSVISKAPSKIKPTPSKAVSFPSRSQIQKSFSRALGGGEVSRGGLPSRGDIIGGRISRGFRLTGDRFGFIQRPPVGRLDLGFEVPSEGLFATRIFKDVPSLGAVIKFQEFGIVQERRGLRAEVTGLVEREFFIPKMQIGSLLGEVQKTKKKKRRRKNKK